MPWVPEFFYVECGAVLRRWDPNGILAGDQIRAAIASLLDWPLRVVQLRGLFSEAWALRANLTFADALYVALAQHLGARLLTDDQRLVRAPLLRVQTLHLA